MSQSIGRIAALFRYPVKSMRGESLAAAELGWHGIEGDRRFALQKLGDTSGFPWLTATRLPELLAYTPLRRDDAAPAHLATHVRTPEGDEWPILAPELAAAISARLGAPVQMTPMRQGVFDDASLSVIATSTVREIATLAAVPEDVRRFRPNVLVELDSPGAFAEDTWLGGALTFGDADDAPAMAVTMRDLRCAMINYDPDTIAASPAMLRTVAQRNDVFAGVYGTVTRTGRLEVGMRVRLHTRG